MRHSKLFFIGIGLLLAGGLVISFYASKAQAGITGSPHDFSSNGWSGGQICIVCHTPHNASGNTIAPLWNHETTGANFQIYQSSTLNASLGQPEGASKACLSCHDGTVAIDSYGGATGTNFIGSGSKLIGTDLRNDHPISFTYDAALATADGGLVTPASASQVVGGIPLYASKMECASCHNVHEYGTGQTRPFLRASKASSVLCLKCHVK